MLEPLLRMIKMARKARPSGWRMTASLLLAGSAGLVVGVTWRKRRIIHFGADQVTYPPLDRLKPVSADLWVVDSGPVRPLGLSLPVRMTVIRLPGGDVLVYSPTRLTDELSRELTALGPVRHLVAPGTAHWTFLKDWQEAYPEARTGAPPGLKRRRQVRRARLRFDHDLTSKPPDVWAGVLDQGLLRGGGFEEVYLYHRPGRTLLLADLVQNLEPGRLPPLSRLAMRLVRSTSAEIPLHVRLALNMRRDSVVPALWRMLAFKPERVIFAHGRWFEERGAERLRAALGRFV